MSDLARTDFAEYRLRSFISDLEECETIEERNQMMKGIIGEVTGILEKRHDLLRRWLLGLDRINKRFALPARAEPWHHRSREGSHTTSFHPEQ